MTAIRKLKLVEQDEEPKDVTMLLRKEIESRDWANVHIASDRSNPVFLPERVRRIWRLA